MVGLIQHETWRRSSAAGQIEHTEPLRACLSAFRASTEAVCMNLFLPFRVLALGVSRFCCYWTSDFKTILIQILASRSAAPI